jgi:hypothetical protein
VELTRRGQAEYIRTLASASKTEDQSSGSRVEDKIQELQVCVCESAAVGGWAWSAGARGPGVVVSLLGGRPWGYSVAIVLLSCYYRAATALLECCCCSVPRVTKQPTTSARLQRQIRQLEDSSLAQEAALKQVRLHALLRFLPPFPSSVSCPLVSLSPSLVVGRAFLPYPLPPTPYPIPYPLPPTHALEATSLHG